jgi:EF hand domain-containing protein
MNGTMKIAALAAVLACSAAFAGEENATTAATGGEWPEFSALDTNGDGNISKDEAKAQSLLASRFSEVDDNKDGNLNPAEYDKARNYMKAPNP